jgi:undecaprenyl-diphosphatase
MTWWQALILGIVEGLTEFLPVSSTGHLILAQRLMGIEQSDASDAYVVAIQIGAILAVVGLYWSRIRGMILGLLGKSKAGLKLAINTLVAFAPAGVVGLLFNHRIEEHLFGLWPITAAWLVGGIAILVADKWRKRREPALKQGKPGLSLDEMTWKLALIIGLVQCVAMWPGTSRSLVTIVAGILVGLRLVAAVEFSFLLGVVTLSAASLYKMTTDYRIMLDHYSGTDMVIGLVTSGIFAAIAVKWMVSYLNRHGLSIFGYYRIALALVVIALLMLDVISAA